MDDRNYDYNNENVIEWIKGSKNVSATFTQERFVNKMEKLAELHPEDVKIVVENADGSIVAHFPLKYLSIACRSRELTEEQREEVANRLSFARRFSNQEND